MIMSDKEHMLFCVLGRSSSGKDTLVNKLCEKTGAKQLISYTTRLRRDREENTHIFVTEEEYKKNAFRWSSCGRYKYQW